MPVLSASVSAFAGERALIRTVKLRAAAGEVVGVIGRSGAGKSTLLRSLFGGLPPSVASSGHVEVEGLRRLAAPDALGPWRGRAITWIRQEAARALHPLYAIGRQLDEGLRRGGVRAGRSARRQMMLDELAQVGLDEGASLLTCRPEALSVGMRQRVLLAMALLPGPKVLLADEPMAALDPVSTAQVMGRIRRWVGRPGARRSCVLVSHSLAMVEACCDRVLVLDRGRVVATGAPRAVLSDKDVPDDVRRMYEAEPPWPVAAKDD